MCLIYRCLLNCLLPPPLAPPAMSWRAFLGPPYSRQESCFGPWFLLSVFAPACCHLPQAPGQEPSSPFTSVCLSVGDDRARTRSFGQILSSFSCSTCQQQTTPGQSSSAQPSWRSLLLPELRDSGRAGIPQPMAGVTMASRVDETAGSVSKGRFTDGDHSGRPCLHFPPNS